MMIEWTGGIDVVEEQQLEAAGLPAAAKAVLRAGLPREIRLPGWLGPTLFTSEIRDGQLARLDRFTDASEHPALARSFVIGTARETAGKPEALGAYCLDPASGEVWAVDLFEPRMARFANSGLDAFVRYLATIVKNWARIQAASDDDARAVVQELRDELAGIDARAFDDADHHWPTFVDVTFDYP